MIISCPHCGTRYKVMAEVIGSAGRKVQCAHCHRDWRALPQPDATAHQEAQPEDDRLFDQMVEDKLDEEFAHAEHTAHAESPHDSNARSLEQALMHPRARRPAPARLDASVLRGKLKAFAAREKFLLRQMPEERLRRAFRVAAAGALVALLTALVIWRGPLVAAFPSLAAPYAAIGLPVNVVGLDFNDLRTLKSLNGGTEKLVIDADIASVSNDAVIVPPVIVTLTDAKGADIYEWSVPPPARRLQAGKAVAFETQLPLPPRAAHGVRLSFGPLGVDKPVPAPPEQPNGD